MFGAQLPDECPNLEQSPNLFGAPAAGATPLIYLRPGPRQAVKSVKMALAGLGAISAVKVRASPTPLPSHPLPTPHTSHPLLISVVKVRDSKSYACPLLVLFRVLLPVESPPPHLSMRTRRCPAPLILIHSPPTPHTFCTPPPCPLRILLRSPSLAVHTHPPPIHTHPT